MKLFAFTLFLVMVLPIVSSVAADEGAGDQLGKTQIKKWSKYYQTRAGQYEILRTDDQRQLVFSGEPVMRWTNLVVSPDITHGECFVGTIDGRPEAFASLFSYNSGEKRKVAHAWNTFSRHPLVASHDGDVFWTPPGSGIDEMRRVPGSPSPSDSRPKRLVQMRQLARSFSARSGGTDGNKELELRLLATPVFRYERESEESLDGGLFVFVTGTDPEVLLLIEARKVDDVLQWQYLPLRHSHLTLRVKHDGAIVWESLRGSTNYAIPAIQRLYLSQHGVDYQERLFP